MTYKPTAATFGEVMRSWRSERRLSQADLASVVETPSRHVSFLETGRAQPSRTMITRLASALNVPLRERNLLFKAAGFADVYPERDIEDREMEMMNKAVTRLMKAQDPYPAFVFDRHWNVQSSNTAGERILALDARPVPGGEDRSANILDLMFDPQGLRPLIANWDDYARQVIQRLHREAMCLGDLEIALDRIARYPGIPNDWRTFDAGYRVDPAFPIQLKLDGTVLNFFTIIAAVATPTDALSQELRVEILFPSDRETETKLEDG